MSAGRRQIWTRRNISSRTRRSTAAGRRPNRDQRAPRGARLPRRSIAHDPEMPTRFAKQLAQIVRGGSPSAWPRPAASAARFRCARDSVPQLRREILLDLAGTRARGRSTSENISKPRIPFAANSMPCTCLACCAVTRPRNPEKTERSTRSERYRLADDYDEETLRMMADKPAREGLF